MARTKSLPTQTPATTPGTTAAATPAAVHPTTSSTRNAGPSQLFFQYYPTAIREKLEEAYATKPSAAPAKTTQADLEKLASWKARHFMTVLPSSIRQQIFRNIFAGAELRLEYTDATKSSAILKDAQRVLSILLTSRTCFEEARGLWRTLATIRVLPAMLPLITTPTYEKHRSRVCQVRINKWELRNLAEYCRGNWRAWFPKLVDLEVEHRPKETVVNLDHTIDNRYTQRQLAALPRTPGVRGFLQCEAVRDALARFNFVKDLELDLPMIRELFHGPKDNKRKRDSLPLADADGDALRMRLAVPLQLYGGKYLEDWPLLESEGFKYRMVDGVEPDDTEIDQWLPVVSDQRPPQ
jgi:hypothetical protein